MESLVFKSRQWTEIIGIYWLVTRKSYEPKTPVDGGALGERFTRAYRVQGVGQSEGVAKLVMITLDAKALLLLGQSEVNFPSGP